MKLLSKGYPQTFWEPAEPAEWADDFGNHGYEGDDYVEFSDGYQLFTEDMAMDAIAFIKQYGKHLDMTVRRAKHNSLLDCADRKIHKGSKYWEFFGEIYSYKTLKETDFREFCAEIAGLIVGEYEYIDEGPDPDRLYDEWRDKQLFGDDDD